jgi:hypothetical protein
MSVSRWLLQNTDTVRVRVSISHFVKLIELLMQNLKEAETTKGKGKKGKNRIKPHRPA